MVIKIYSEVKEDFDLITEIDFDLEEWHNYELMFEKTENPKLHKKIFKPHKSGTGGRLNFQNFVGDTEIEGKWIQVKSKKFDKDQFEGMLNEVKDQMANLPFSYDAPTYLPYERVPETAPEILYHDFAYLRYIMCQMDKRDHLESQIRKILYDPHRKLDKEDHYINVDKIHRIDSKTLSNILLNTKNLIKLSASSQLRSTTLGRKLTIDDQTYYPSKVLSSIIISSYDTPENRFIKYFLKQCESIINAFKDYIQSSEKLDLIDSNLERDIEYMLNFLKTIQVDSIFSEVEDITFIPIGSSILQKKEGYRDILEFYSLLNMRASYNPMEINLQRIIQNKDIAILYEYWCFFKVKEILEDSLGKCRKAIGAKINELYSDIEHELCIEFGKDCKLYYNKSFRKGRKESYSLLLRPDIALEIGKDIYLFDAKFRIDKLPEEKTSEEDEETIDSTYKKIDLYKMHTYKDAIIKAKSVFILYPGEEERFYPKSCEKINLPGGLKQVIRDIISPSPIFSDGVGAISLIPSKFKK